MPEIVNTTPLQDPCSMASANDSPADIMINVENVSMVFNMASEQLNSLKEYAIALMKKELRFKELRALDNVSLEIRKGDVFGILGTNGSGKSTLLKIVAGVLEPTEGSVTINGNIAPLIELGAGFDLELTARENIYLNGALLGYSKKFIDENFDEIVEFAEVEKFLDMPMKNYSSGMVARIAFAIATVIVPDILIVDEVLSVGDFMFQQKCERRITKLIKEHDVTVLIVSHSNDQIERLCNKAVWIEKGHTRMVGNAKDVCRTYRVLGGHTGSPESEQRVFDMLNDRTVIPEGVIESISAEDRYGSAVKLNELASFSGNSIVIAPGDDASACLIGASLAAALDSPMYPCKTQCIPDMTSQAIKASSFRNVVILSRGTEVFSNAFFASLRALRPAAEIKRIENESIEKLSLSAYQDAEQTSWGKTAIVTWDGGTGDLLSILPYSQFKRMPVFFLDDKKSYAPVFSNILIEENFEQLIIFGDDSFFPVDCLEKLREHNIEVIRFWGSGAFDANKTINEWLEAQAANSGYYLPDEIIVSTIWNPYDALSAGPYACMTHSAVLLEDPQNLDSVAQAIDYIEHKRGQIRKLTFLGDHNRFTDLDKSLLGKALAKDMQA